MGKQQTTIIKNRLFYGTNLMLILRSTVPVTGVMLDSGVDTACIVTHNDGEGVTHSHLQLGELQLGVVTATVASPVRHQLIHEGGVIGPVSKLQEYVFGKYTSVLFNFLFFLSGNDCDVLHGVTK